MKRIAVLALAAASSVALAAAPYRPSPPATVRVTGRAELPEAPDRVFIDLGVTTQAPTSEAASSENASRLEGVIAAIRRSAGSGAQLTTARYSLAPEYQYRPNSGPATIAGYTATNVVRVRLDDLSRIGPVIDAASRAGANRVESIRFTLRDPQRANAQALRIAALNASGEARALASALDLTIVRILSVDEQGPAVVPVRPVFMQSAKLAAAPSATPIESGMLDVTATVTLTAEVAPAAR